MSALTLFELSHVFTIVEFFASTFTNLILIFLTAFYVKNLFGTYKRMVIYFSTLGIVFSALEITAKPFSHNYNGSLLYFSTSELPETFVSLLMSSWSAFYIIVVAFIAVQFVYRYLCLTNYNATKKFDGVKTVFWIIYPLVPGAFYTISMNFLCAADEYSDSYVQ